MHHDDSRVYRYARDAYLRAHGRERVTADPPRGFQREPTPYSDSLTVVACIEPPVRECRVQPSRGQAVNSGWGELLKCKDISLCTRRSHQIFCICPPLEEVC